MAHNRETWRSLLEIELEGALECAEKMPRLVAEAGGTIETIRSLMKRASDNEIRMATLLGAMAVYELGDMLEEFRLSVEAKRDREET